MYGFHGSEHRLSPSSFSHVSAIVTRPLPTLQVRKRKWENYSSGEELFGLKVTKYPELEQTEKEVTMLDRLYT